VSREDSLYLGPNSLAAHRDSFSAAAGNTRYIDSLWEPMPEADIILKDGDTVAGFTALHLPGHTEGSMGFLDEAGRRLYSGDTLFRAGVGRTDLPGGDWDALLASLRRLFALDGRIRVYPGHGPSTTISNEAASGFLPTP
jgi:glyoxylase-like metal-dependent hydrolase (beta-lactamase superfamily II)